MKSNDPYIKPEQVTKNAGKIQNLLLRFGAEMSNTSSGYTQGGSGFESREEIAQNILNASNCAYNRLQLDKTEQYNNSYTEQLYAQPQYQMQQMQPSGVMPAYPITPPQRTNFIIEEDMETIDISKYIGAAKKEQPNPVQGDMGMLLKEMKETNKRLEAMCKILGLIYQQNIKNNTVTPADYGFNTVEQVPQNVEDNMSIEEETEMINNLPNIPAVDPLADDESEQ